MVQFASRKDTVASFEIETRLSGEGPALVYLHGTGGASDFFVRDRTAPFLVDLAQTFHVLVPEHPGYGAAETPDWLDNIHDMAFFYLDYFDALGLDDIHLVGSSIGGWIALEIAVRNTSRLKSLTLCAAAGLRVKGVPTGDVFLWSPEKFAQNCLRNPAARENFLALEPGPEQEVIRLRNQQTSALLAWQPRFYDPDLHKWLHRIDIPTHIVWAEDDRVLPHPYAEALAEHIPGSTISIVPQSGHLMHLDNPEGLSRAVADFISERAS